MIHNEFVNLLNDVTIC